MATARLLALVVKTFEDLVATTRLQPEYMPMELVLFEIRLGLWPFVVKTEKLPILLAMRMFLPLRMVLVLFPVMP